MGKWIYRVHNLRFRQKLFIFGLLLGCLPVSIVGVFSYFRSSGIIDQMARENNYQGLLQTQMHVEHILMNADTMLRSFVESPIANEAINSRMMGKDFQYFQEVYKQLNTLQPFDAVNTDACLVSTSGNWVINSSGLHGITDSEHREQYESLARLPSASMWVTSYSPQKSEKVYDYFFWGNAVDLVKKIPINSMKPSGVAMIKIPCEYLSQFLVYGNKYGEVLIFDNEFNVIADYNRTMIGKNLASAGYIKKILLDKRARGNFDFKTDRNNINVTYLKSEYNDWYYVSTISTREIEKQSMPIGWLTLIACLFCLAAVSIFSIIGSRKMYKPILNIYNYLLKNETTVKEQDEFSFIRKSVGALMDKQTSLEDQLDSQIHQIKEFFTMKIIMGDIENKEIESKLKLFTSLSDKKWKSILVVEIDSLKGTSYEDGSSDLIMFFINNLVSQLLERKYLLMPVIINKLQVTILGGNQDTCELFMEEIYQISEKIQNEVNNNFGIPVSIGISRTFEDFKDANRAFHEAVEALKYRIRLGNNAILFIEDVEPAQSMQPLTYMKIQNQLIDAMRSADEEKINALLDQFLIEVFRMKVNHMDYKIIIIGLLTALMMTMLENDESSKLLDGMHQSLLEQIYGLQTQDDIKYWIKNVIIHPFVKNMQEANHSRHREIVTRMLKIIEDDFGKNLTIETCAEKMNYHPGYIRRVFLSETGENFGEYLTKYRIEKAKQWLADTDLLISDIAERLNYSNSQNFIRSFRKYTGVTPGHYRDENNKIINERYRSE